MTYTVKEIFHTIQGEGINAGRPAVFCRFAGCNLWSGNQKDKPGAVCNFCDTDFIGGFKVAHPMDLAWSIAGKFAHGGDRLVVLTGGEPLLQVDDILIASLKRLDIEVAVETNGTIGVPGGIDWLCVSPKGMSHWIQKTGNELKLAYPQIDLMPDEIDMTGFDHYLIQPIDGPELKQNTESAIEWVKRNSGWRLSIQTHKYLGIA